MPRVNVFIQNDNYPRWSGMDKGKRSAFVNEQLRYDVGSAVRKSKPDNTMHPRTAIRIQTARDIFSLAHEYARQDPSMHGSEELRAYHYYNAIAKIGEFGKR